MIYTLRTAFIAPKKITENLFNNQLIYFTSNSLFNDDNSIVFIREQNGNPNIYLTDIISGDEVQLTKNSSGYLKSYVYFDGNPYKGFGKASVSVHSPSGKIYFIQGRKICSVDADGKITELNEYPEEQMTAFTHVSSDGKYLCVPTIDAFALDGDNKLTGKPDYDIDERVRKEHLSSYLRVYDTKSGEELFCEKVPDAWITHVQFSPVNSEIILYNNEWPSDCGIRRMWLWNGNRHIALRTENENRRKEDWTCHEMWERDGSAVIYHGSYKDGPAYIGRVKLDEDEIIEIPLPAGWVRYGHFTEGKPGILVTDGYYDNNSIPNSANTNAKDPSIDIGLKKSEISGEWISILKVDWENRNIKWIPICQHGSSWDSQDCHPHPIFNHKADTIFFNSDKEGNRSIYSVNVADIL